MKSKGLFDEGARLIVLLWAGFWTFFAVACSGGIGGLFSHWAPLTVVSVLWATVVVAWRPTVMAGLVLVAEALTVAAWYFVALAPKSPANWIAFVVGSLIAPPLGAGLMMLVGKGFRRREDAFD